jgi:hypothetical protein
MFHTHVERLFDHRVFHIYVRTWANVASSTFLMLVSLQSLIFESFFLAVEDSVALKTRLCGVRFASRSLESSWPYLIISPHSILWLAGMTYVGSVSLRILARAWNIKLQTLSIEHLIVIETRGRMVEANVLTREHFVIHCSFFSCPFCSSVLEVILAFLVSSDDVFYAVLPEQGALAKLRVIASFFLLVWVQNSHIRARFF